MRVELDEDRCVGAGQCVLHAAEVFDQSDEAIGLVLVSEPSEELWDKVRGAADRCPGRAINLVE